MMKAIRIHEYGDAGVLRYEDAPVPDIRADEVLVKIHAAGVNPADWKIRAGYLRHARPLTFPAILGLDASGTIERVGPAVGRFKAGDKVFFRAPEGSYAEYAAAKSDIVAFAPETIPLSHAAAIPVVGCTAWTVLFDSARLEPGRTVLIEGGAGGVGTFAIQLAKLAGLRVIATASAANLDVLKSLGADQAIDYRTEDVAATLKDVDLVFDCVGGETLERALRVVRRGGLVISIASPPDEELAKEHGVTARFERGVTHAGRLAEIAALVDAGKLKVIVEREYQLAEAAAAHAHSESGRSRGKLILRAG